MKKAGKQSGTKVTKTKKAPRKRIQIDGVWYSVRGVPLTRASGTKTEAEFWSFILSALRKATRFWKPAVDKKTEGRRPSQSANKRLKWESLCESCNKWVAEKDIEIDHIVPCGGINGSDKVVGWIDRAFVEINGFQRLCKTCHLKKTNEESK